MPGDRNITNDRLYDALNSMRLELKGDITRLENKFDSLEAGRLTRLEAKMTDFEVSQIKKDSAIQQNQAILSTKFMVGAAIAIAIFNAVLYGVFTRIFSK